MDHGCRLIVARFRLLRIKEVDIVLEAFYLAQQTPDVPGTEAVTEEPTEAATV
jgi:hypothetical protein